MRKKLTLCPYCKKEARWVDNKEIYGRRYGKSYMMWFCRDCDAYVGCHNNTKTPLGTLANKELREKRVETHRLIDPLWRDGNMSRPQLYELLKNHFGREIHIGESDIDMCEDITNFITTLKK